MKKQSNKKPVQAPREIQKFIHIDYCKNSHTLAIGERDDGTFWVQLYDTESRIPFSLSNVMAIQRKFRGYQAECDGFRDAVLKAYKSGGDVLQAIKNVTNDPNRWEVA